MSHRFSFCIGKSDGGNYDNDNCSNSDYDDRYKEGKGEILRAGKPRDSEDVEEDRHQVGV